jgi:spore germination protein GerM
VRRRLTTALLSLGVLAAGCGVDPQSAPSELDVSPLPRATADDTGGTAGSELVLWFLDGGRLVPVERPAAEQDPATALALLAEGPTAEEAAAGLSTAISRQPLVVVDREDVDALEGVLAVEVTPAFTGVSGADQLAEVAQVVWTATEFPDVDAVAFTTEDGPLEVPTDSGLGDRPVGRDDYASLAPVAGDAPASPGPP